MSDSKLRRLPMNSIAPDPSEQMDDGEEDASHEWHAEDGTDQGDFVDDDGEELSRVIEELCNSKAEEFALLGYDSVTGKDIWEFVSEQYDLNRVSHLCIGSLTIFYR